MNKPTKTSKAKEFKILAGTMFIQEGKFKANPAKGEIRIFLNNDSNHTNFSKILLLGLGKIWRTTSLPNL